MLALLGAASLLAGPWRVAHADATARDRIPPLDGKYENVVVARGEEPVEALRILIAQRR